MTLDEARNRLIGLIRPIKVKLFDTEVKVKQEEYYPETKPIIEAIEYAIAGLEELNWYREQDLIPRDKAYSILLHNGKEHYLNNGMHNDEVTNIIDKMIAEVEQIPKAKPPFATDTNVARNGDCETCKNVTLKVDDICVECINGIDHYEPYIPVVSR